MKRPLLIFFMLGVMLTLQAQRTGMGKLSPWLRQLIRTEQSKSPNKSLSTLNSQLSTFNSQLSTLNSQPIVTAFVRITSEADDVLATYHCRNLAQTGSIHIAAIPLHQLPLMAADDRVSRIEARPMGQTLTDSMAFHLNAMPVYEGQNLPQAFTGKGVVVGLMDIGFDLTHPNFYSRDTTCYRICRLWDMLSTDTVGSPFIVGRDYTTREELLALRHTRDGEEMTHGTHTLGIAAGSGYDSPYRGMAYESDICLVANGVSDNAALIDSSLYERFNFTTDALGFKYIFDYAKSVGKPCVASFSEGSSQDFWGYDQLYYEMLDSLLGPGRILVSAAGNQGRVKTWFRKEPGTLSKGCFLQGSSSMIHTLKSADDFTIRFVTYNQEGCDTVVVSTKTILAAEDSIFSFSMNGLDSIAIEAYPSCYVPRETCYDLMLFHSHSIGFSTPLSLEVMGTAADVEFWRVTGALATNDLAPWLDAGECVSNVFSPSSSPRVVCVGSTTWRDSIQNVNGQWKHYWLGDYGRRAPFSSVGPTFDGRIKPDVMAPGNNIISSLSSFFMEHHPEAGDMDWNVAQYSFNGRTYAWNSNTGTSSSCPAVAGAIAIWLQAKPDLTPEEVFDVIARTSRKPDPSLAYPNNEYGHGEIDVYRGLLYILGIDRVHDVSTNHTRAQVSLSGRRLTVTLPAVLSSPLRLRLYSLSGRLCQEQVLSPSQSRYELSLPSSLTGIYAVQLDGVPSLSGSTLIRL